MSKVKRDYPRLLPVGLGDLLPPYVSIEDGLLRCLSDYFGSSGYCRVKPPLLEFESSFSGVSNSSGKSFRVMDPMSYDSRLLAVRHDMTMQVARIGTERLVNWARPLRLFYSGEVLRTQGSQLRPERQFLQVGAEILCDSAIMSDSAKFAEVIELGHLSLGSILGLGVVSFDLSLPSLCVDLLSGVDIDMRGDILSALSVRDGGYLGRLDFEYSGFLSDLVSFVGDYDSVIGSLDSLDFPSSVRGLYDEMKLAVDLVRSVNRDIRLTVDLVEGVGFEYQSGLSFGIYADGVKGLLGRGGIYCAGSVGESACGFSLYMDSLLRLCSSRVGSSFSVLASSDNSLASVSDLRFLGYTVIEDVLRLSDRGLLRERALSCGFSHILWSGDLEDLGGGADE